MVKKAHSIDVTGCVLHVSLQFVLRTSIHTEKMFSLTGTKARDSSHKLPHSQPDTDEPWILHPITNPYATIVARDRKEATRWARMVSRQCGALI